MYGICNVVGASIPRNTDSGTYIHVGPEIGVASTKAFTGQVTVLMLLALCVGQMRGTVDDATVERIVRELKNMPLYIKDVLGLADKIKNLSKIYTYARNFLYLGRGYNYPTALEGALKLKEISYIHAEGYPAAEMKNIISHTNGVYCAAIAFIYAHEFSHNYLGHTQIQQTFPHTIDDEIAADDTAISFIQTEYDSAWGNTYKAGVATVLAAILLMSEDSISGDGTHPDMDVRIENLVTKLELHEMDPLWGYLGVALRLWLLVFGGLSIEEDMQQPGFGSYKEIYLFYMEKLKTVRQQRYPKIVKPDWDI